MESPDPVPDGRVARTLLAARDAGLSLGRPFGVPVVVSPMWFVYSAVISAGVFAPLLRDRVSGLGAGGALIAGIACALLLGASVLAHELAHCVTARALGMTVRRLRLLVMGGSTDIEGQAISPARDYLVAMSGPLVSVLLGGVFAAAGRSLHGGLGVRVAAETCTVIGATNALLAGFNLLPALPLDGGRVAAAAIWRLSGDRVRAARLAGYAGFAVAGLCCLYGLTLLPRARSDLDLVAPVLAVFLALFLTTNARLAIEQALLLDLLPRLDLHSLARPMLRVRDDVPLAEALRRAAEAGRDAVVATGPDDEPRGLLARPLLAATPQERRPWVSLASVTRPLTPGLILGADLRGQAVLDALRRTPSSEYLVIEPGGSVMGVLSTADVTALVRRRPRRTSGRPSSALR